MEKKFKLGPIQKAWLKSLVENASKQMTGQLGQGTPKDYKACCLGEGLVCIAKAENIPLSNIFNDKGIISDGVRRDGSIFTGTLGSSWKKLGLKSSSGYIDIEHHQHIPKLKDGAIPQDLAVCNDNSMTWPQIAEFIKKYPQAVFDESK